MYRQKPPSFPLTKQAYDKLRADLSRLSKERKEVMERLNTAREMGDLSENGAYKYAKFEIARINRLLRDIRHQLDNGIVTAIKSVYSHIEFGCQVTLKSGDKQVVYAVVSQYESNPLEHRISLESPLGSAIAGKSVGEIVDVTTPKGIVQYTIVEIK